MSCKKLSLWVWGKFTAFCWNGPCGFCSIAPTIARPATLDIKKKSFLYMFWYLLGSTCVNYFISIWFDILPSLTPGPEFVSISGVLCAVCSCKTLSISVFCQEGNTCCKYQHIWLRCMQHCANSIKKWLKQGVFFTILLKVPTPYASCKIWRFLMFFLQFSEEGVEKIKSN